MAGFSKLFGSMWGGSLYGHFEASAVFMVLLSLANADGIVDMTPEAIAGTTGWPLDVIKKGLAELESPDTRSRTNKAEGRRIIRIDDHRDWGWRITNYLKYRDEMRSVERRAYLTEKQRERRARQHSSTLSTSVNHCQPIAEAEAEAELSTSLRSVDKRASRLPATWAPVIHNDWEYQQLEVFRDYWKSQPGQKGVKADWDATWRNWLRRAKDYDAKQHPRKQSAVDRVRQACNLDADGFPVGTDDGDVRAQVGEQLRGKPKRGVVEGDFRIVDGAD